jgi:hypothetical protein
MACYENGKLDVCAAIEGHPYYCCTYAYTGTP